MVQIPYKLQIPFASPVSQKHTICLTGVPSLCQANRGQEGE